MKPAPPRVKLEICTASVEDCVKAEQGGADRIELNCALALGGLTPSFGALRESISAVKIPIISMIRPRASGFCYSRAEFKVMLQDAETALAEGSAGIAVGILTARGDLDAKRCRQLVELAAGRQIVFHRAFDVVRDPLKTLEQLIDLGFTRVMTSGQEASAYNGAANIAEYVKLARRRIQILPAGGVNRFTVADILARTGCDQVHASLSGTSFDHSTAARPQVSFGGTLKYPEPEYTSTNLSAVAAMRRSLGK
jgi:copper homeostasis protein